MTVSELRIKFVMKRIYIGSNLASIDINVKFLFTSVGAELGPKIALCPSIKTYHYGSHFFPPFTCSLSPNLSDFLYMEASLFVNTLRDLSRSNTLNK